MLLRVGYDSGMTDARQFHIDRHVALGALAAQQAAAATQGRRILLAILRPQGPSNIIQTLGLAAQRQTMEELGKRLVVLFSATTPGATPAPGSPDESIKNVSVNSIREGQGSPDALSTLLFPWSLNSSVPGTSSQVLPSDAFVISRVLGANESPEMALAKWTTRLSANLKAPLRLADSPVRLGIQAGLALWPDHASAPAPLLDRAIRALRQAEKSGPGTSLLWHAALEDPQAPSLEVALQRAVHEKQFILYYQPKVDLATGKPIGAEALLRWRRPRQHVAGLSHAGPEFDIVFPGAFMHLLERSNLILPLGDWVIHQACQQMEMWREHGLDIPVSVNISAQQVAGAHAPLNNRHPDMGLLSSVKHALSQHPGVELTLELTETASLSDLDRAAELFRALSDLGVRIELDDFGVGFSSFSYLRRLPVHGLKVDRSFVASLPAPEGQPEADLEGIAGGSGTPGSARPILAAMLAMGREMGLDVVAEGVEHSWQVEILRDLGCKTAQGYAFSRPLDPASFELWWRRRVNPVKRPLPDGV